MFGALIPLVSSIIGAFAAKKSGDKAKQAVQLDPATQAIQNQALQYQQARMMLMQPLFERLAAGANQRLPASYGAPTIGQMQSPYAGQAFSQLARRMPPPEGRQRYQA